MSEIKCPICDRINDASAERCWYCQAILHPEKEASKENSDWLDGFRENTEPPPAEKETPTKPESSSEEVPDWLARIREREKIEQTGSTPADQAGSGDSIDWLREFSENDNESESTAPETPEPESPGEPETPAGSAEDGNDDWLKKLDSWQSNEEQNKSVSFPVEDEKAPEAPTPSADKIENEPPEDTKPKFVPGVEPDWLHEFLIEANAPESTPADEIPVVAEENTKSEPVFEAGTAEPTLPPEDVHVIPPAEEKQPEPVIPPEVAESGNVVKPSSPEPDWLSEFQAIDPEKDLADQVLPANSAEQVARPPFSGKDMLNWIDKDAEKPEGEIPQEVKIPVEKIEPGSLPPWLQALRTEKSKSLTPIETSSSVNGDIKSPLAEIEGVLQGDAVTQFYTRPQTYANTLKITPEQENHLLRLQTIAGEAQWETQDDSRSKPARRNLLRIMISLMILGVVFFALLTQKSALVTPTLYPQSVVQSYNTIKALDVNHPVLIAADFDSSLYGELKWPTEALLTQLMKQNESIAYLSTTSVGTTLLQDTLTTLAERQPGYSLAEKTNNLGYLAGGIVGLQALAQDPQTTIPRDVKFHPAWANAPWSSVKKISDFSAVIVITENADTARYWVEQVKPSLGNTPLLVVISAQSAPMLQPYYDSGQVNGYIAGESDGSAFENLSSSSSSANQHFSAFQLTLIIVALMIFIGGMISLVLRNPSEERSGAAKK